MATKKEKTGKKERKPNWQEYMATPDDIKAFIDDRMFLRYNVVTKRVEYRLLSSYEQDATEWQPINDHLVNSIWVKLSREKKVKINHIYTVIESDSVPDFHPFKDYLDRLPKWDGQDYILGMSVSVSVKGSLDK